MLDNTIVLWGNELPKGNCDPIDPIDPISLVMAGGSNLEIDTGRFLIFDDGSDSQPGVGWGASSDGPRR